MSPLPPARRRTDTSRRSVCALLGVSLLGAFAAGCSPASTAPLKTNLWPPPEGVKLEPPPPPGVFYLRVRSAKIPLRSQGGQLWDAQGAFPDPFVRLSIGNEELLRTTEVANTLEPVFTDPGANHAIDSGAEILVEVLDADPLLDRPMGRATIPVPGSADLDLGEITIDTGNHGQVVLEVGRAHALYGLGFDYEAYHGRAAVTEVWQFSPASRGGMTVGDEIVAIGEKAVKNLNAKEIRSAINALGSKGAQTTVRHRSGTTESFQLTVGPIYPLVEEYGPLP
ncbi:MAG: hypothetical protein R3B72_21910 [Polyangiaceae bacterium]